MKQSIIDDAALGMCWRRLASPSLSRRDNLVRPRSRYGLTILELLVTIAIISVAAGLLLPALSAVRESARRVECISHLRELGLALHNHHDSQGSLPAGWRFDSTNQSAFGWVVPALPYLDQAPLKERIDYSKPVHAPVHESIRATSLEVMLCPSDLTEPTFTLYEAEEPKGGGEHALSVGSSSFDPETIALTKLPTANYLGVFGTIEPDDSIPAPLGDGAFLENRSVRFREFQRGLSHTFLVGERTMAQVPSTWFGVSLAGEDAAARVVGSALEGINNPWADECDFSSRHPGGVNFLWGDGHVSFVGEEIDLHEYHQFARLRP